VVFERQSVGRKSASRPKLEPHQFLDVVEQQIKKWFGDKIVLGCFFNLESAAYVGCVLESTAKYRKVKKRHV
jgi:hypothetical protein